MAFGAIPGSVRSLFLAAVPGLLKQGLGSNAMISWAKGTIGGYRRVNMLQDIRRITGLAKLEKAVRLVSPDVMFPQYTMVESNYRAARRYFVKGKMTVTDDETGEESERWVSFYSNKRMTKQVWTEDFIAGYAEGRYGAYETIKDVSIVSVEHKRGWAY